MNELEEAGLRLKLAAAECERDELRAKIAEHDDAAELVQEYVDATAAAMDETCGKNEKHCTCVPLLRHEANRIRAEAATYAKSVHRLQKAFDDQCNASRQDASEIEKLKKERDSLAAKVTELKDILADIFKDCQDNPDKDRGHVICEASYGEFRRTLCAIANFDRGHDYVPRKELDEANEQIRKMKLVASEMASSDTKYAAVKSALKECVEALGACKVPGTLYSNPICFLCGDLKLSHSPTCKIGNAIEEARRLL